MVSTSIVPEGTVPLPSHVMHEFAERVTVCALPSVARYAPRMFR
jgi:hypothetical protein